MIYKLFLGYVLELKQDVSFLIEPCYYIIRAVSQSNGILSLEDDLVRVKLKAGTIVKLKNYDLKPAGVNWGRLELRDDSLIGIQYKTVGRLNLSFYKGRELEKVIKGITGKLKETQ